jgi:hypothetical protein
VKSAKPTSALEVQHISAHDFWLFRRGDGSRVLSAVHRVPLVQRSDGETMSSNSAMNSPVIRVGRSRSSPPVTRSAIAALATLVRSATSLSC